MLHVLPNQKSRIYCVEYFFFFEDDFYSSIREMKMHHKDSTFPVLNTFLGNYPSKHIL